MSDDLQKRVADLEAKLAAVDGLEGQVKSRMNHAMLDASWQVRKQMIAFCVVAGVVVAASAGLSIVSLLRSRPSAVQDNVRSRRFELLDPNGKVRFVLADEGKEGSGFALLDREGRRRGSFRLDEKGQARFAIAGEGGKEQVQILLNEDGEPCFNLCDKSGRARIGTIVEQKRGDQTFMFQSDPAGKVLWKAP